MRVLGRCLGALRCGLQLRLGLLARQRLQARCLGGSLSLHFLVSHACFWPGSSRRIVARVVSGASRRSPLFPRTSCAPAPSDLHLQYKPTQTTDGSLLHTSCSVDKHEQLGALPWLHCLYPRGHGDLRSQCPPPLVTARVLWPAPYAIRLPASRFRCIVFRRRRIWMLPGSDAPSAPARRALRSYGPTVSRTCACCLQKTCRLATTERRALACRASATCSARATRTETPWREGLASLLPTPLQSWVV